MVRAGFEPSGTSPGVCSKTDAAAEITAPLTLRFHRGRTWGPSNRSLEATDDVLGKPLELPLLLVKRHEALIEEPAEPLELPAGAVDRA